MEDKLTRLKYQLEDLKEALDQAEVLLNLGMGSNITELTPRDARHYLTSVCDTIDKAQGNLAKAYQLMCKEPTPPTFFKGGRDGKVLPLVKH